MAVVYILGSLTIIFSNYDMILPAFKEIIVGAFDPSAPTGGIIGASLKEAIRYGVARGLFSNEAGMGSTPHAHALAQVKHPCEQGLVAYVGLFFDTFIVLNMTALVILTTGVLDGKSTGIVLTQAAFTAGLGDIGPGFVAICLFSSPLRRSSAGTSSANKTSSISSVCAGCRATACLFCAS